MKRFNVVPTYPDKTVGEVDIDKKHYYVCEVCGRLSFRKIRAYKHTYCQKHYNQQKRFGHTLDENPRTLMDRNECYIDDDGVGHIMIYDKDCNHIATAKVDGEDLKKVMYTKWKLSSSGYAMNAPKFKGGNIHMSRVILNTDQFVDHINHDTLDNRKCNLRIVTKSQNQMNANYKGIGMCKGKYYARIKKNGILVQLGTYVFEEEALYARWYAEKLVFKEFRYPKPEPQILEHRKQQIQKLVKCKVQRL